MSKSSIKGKILLYGKIECCSPLHIGSGAKERSELDIVCDEHGTPFIPATTFVGVLYHAITNRHIFPQAQSDKFWGFTREDDGHQSSFRCSDLVCDNAAPDVTIRDGIAIVNASGIVKEEAKYDYELVEPGTTFRLNMEFTYKDDDHEFVEQMAATIYTLLKESKIQIGAKTNSGLGVIRLLEEQSGIYKLDFSQPDHIRLWLTSERENGQWIAQDLGEMKLSGEELNAFLEKGIQISAPQFCIDVTLQLKNSLIIRSYSPDPNLPDAVHITTNGANGKPVLTGTSLKGAIRARAERIVNTLGKSESIITELFGYVKNTITLTRQSFRDLEKEGIPREILDQLHRLKNKECKTEKQLARALEHVISEESPYISQIVDYAVKDFKNAKKGRIRVEEVTLPEYPAELQTRIRIDRFTGGTIEGALFDSMPLFGDDQEEIKSVHIVIEDCKDYEAGLLLLVLKDLWSGDLAIGGEKSIGRGVFQGIEATVNWKEGKFTIQKDITTLSPEDKKALQDWVAALNAYQPQETQEGEMQHEHNQSQWT